MWENKAELGVEEEGRLGLSFPRDFEAPFSSDMPSQGRLVSPNDTFLTF